MIVFNLVCGNDHSFEGWFGSSTDFDEQKRSAMLTCPVCGNSEITKALHAPHVNTGSAESKQEVQRNRLKGEHYANTAQALEQLVEQFIASTEDVGDAFPEEARRIYYKETPDRKIRGNASREEVKELRDEGIEVVALPVPKNRLDKSH